MNTPKADSPHLPRRSRDKIHMRPFCAAVAMMFFGPVLTASLAATVLSDFDRANVNVTGPRYSRL